VRPDGRVDVTAAQAWPNRVTEPKALTPDEIARACAVIGACTQSKGSSTAQQDQDMAFATALCAIPDGSEERVIPIDQRNERWSFRVRQILSAISCDTVTASLTDRPLGITCEEDGCWWSSNTPIPTVRCDGDVATLTSGDKTFVRDCARALTKCDATSPTGCTDRAPVACDPAGNDRCDGDVKLGCDHQGRVSFHDCALVGKKCVESADGASCAPAHTSACSAGSSCDTSSGKLSVCAVDQMQAVDCKALGFSGCVAGHCAK
jgi:hypothetical protein